MLDSLQWESHLQIRVQKTWKRGWDPSWAEGVDGGGWDQGQGRQACVPGCARIVEKSGPMPATSGAGQRMGSLGSTWNYGDGREEL